MPVVLADDSTMPGQIRCRKSRNLPHPTITALNHHPDRDPISLRCKPTISSILLSSSPTNEPTSKKKNFTSATFRGLGCTASSQVSVPAVIRTSANWEAKKLKKKRLKTKKNDKMSIPNNSASASASASASSTINNPSPQSSLSLALSSSCVNVPDVWCGPGIGLTTDAASVDCVVSRRHSRGKVDGVDRIVLGPRERPNTVRRMVAPDDPFLDSDTTIGVPRILTGASASRHYRHARHGFREGLAEIVMFQNSMLMGGRSDGLDRYRDLRLDVDNMSYEELLELGDRIGYVSTGLGEDDIGRCLRRTKVALFDDLSLLFASGMERQCSICQEEYQGEDEMGKLSCGHLYHMECIKQWLGHKNSCPVCKTAAVAEHP